MNKALKIGVGSLPVVGNALAELFNFVVVDPGQEKHIGTLLARHEAYCAGRRAEDKISPGMRWGLWWACYTANRRFFTVKLRRDDLLATDPLGEPGWGRAMWPAAMMKARRQFWLPLPSPVRDVAVGSMTDWCQLVANEHGDLKTDWVFASTRRDIEDDPENDVSVYSRRSACTHVAAQIVERGRVAGELR